MTILFAYMTITLQLRHGSLFRGSAVMSLQFTKSAPLPAEAGCKSGERIGLYCIAITWQQRFTFEKSYSSRRFALCD